MVDDPQSGFLHRHLVVPFVVVPFFFICPVHTGHRGLFGVTGKANQHPATTLKRRSGGLNEKRARIRTKSLFKPDLYSLICGNRKNQTHILLLNPRFFASRKHPGNTWAAITRPPMKRRFFGSR